MNVKDLSETKPKKPTTGGDGDESGISGDEEGDQNELNLTARPSLQRPLHRHLL